MDWIYFAEATAIQQLVPCQRTDILGAQFKYGRKFLALRKSQHIKTFALITFPKVER